jgi:hypothetical protein
LREKSRNFFTPVPPESQCIRFGFPENGSRRLALPPSLILIFSTPWIHLIYFPVWLAVSMHLDPRCLTSLNGPALSGGRRFRQRLPVAGTISAIDHALEWSLDGRGVGEQLQPL